MYVSSEKFDIKRLSFETEGEDNKKRVVLKYNYINRGISNLSLTLNKDCFVECRGVYEELFRSNKTGKHITTFILDRGVDSNVEIYKVLESIYEKIAKHEKSKKVVFPVKDEEDSDRSFVYCRFIEGSDGKMHSVAYDCDNQNLDICMLRRCTARPMISISYPVTSLDKVNVKFSVFQIQVREMLQSGNSLLDDSQDEP